MIPTHKRFEDQDGFIAKAKWILCHPFIMSIAGSSLVVFVVWISGVFSAFPATYAQKSEVTNLALRQLSDYRDLEARKMNKEDYLREHALLREEMTRGFAKLDNADEKILNAVLSVRTNQIIQYKKVNKESDFKGDR